MWKAIINVHMVFFNLHLTNRKGDFKQDSVIRGAAFLSSSASLSKEDKQGIRSITQWTSWLLSEQPLLISMTSFIVTNSLFMASLTACWKVWDVVMSIYLATVIVHLGSSIVGLARITSHTHHRGDVHNATLPLLLHCLQRSLHPHTILQDDKGVTHRCQW